jgi:LPS-assembly protein
MSLLAGACLLAFAATAAVAQTPQAPAGADNGAAAGAVLADPPAVLRAPSADSLLDNQAFYLEADNIVRDDQAQTWDAHGQVEVRYQGRTLRADRVFYEGATGVVTARGKVAIINADGSTEFADAITLDKTFSAGVAMGFSTRQPGNMKISSVAAIKRSATSTEMNRAIFTPCDICREDGVTPKKPTWSIHARQVIQDKDKQVVYYRNAVITVMGVPVLFAPVFWHPDPQAVRRSGLLTPKVDYTKRRGWTYEQPYLWVINPSTDLIVSPQLNSAVNPFLNTEYRQRFWSGEIDIRGGIGHDQDFSSTLGKFGDDTTRSYLLAEGAFKPDRKWTLGFSGERVSDDLLFRRYGVQDVYHNRGLYLADDQRLISQVYAVRQDQRSYFSIAAISVQGLRPTDNDSTIPTIGPLVEAHWEPKNDIFGGRLRLNASGVGLFRDQDAGNTITGRLPNPKLPGVDSSRASFDGEWRRIITTSAGLRLEPFGDLRGDFYKVSDRVAADGKNGTFSRALGTVGMDVSWPFIRYDKNMTLIVEPIAQVALSPTSNHYKDIPNEDSVVFDFDETNLFEYNKSPGFDLYEGGQRLNVGARVTANWNWGLSARAMAGRSFRAEDDPSFPVRTSLDKTTSDWVTAGSITLNPHLFVYGRARLADQTYKVRRAEVGFNVNFSRLQGSARYLIDQIDLTGVKREDLQFSGDLLLTKHWGLTTNTVADLENDVWTHTEFGVLYKDECTRLEIVYERDGTYDRSFTPSSTVSVRLTLATLGNVNPQEASSSR